MTYHLDTTRPVFTYQAIARATTRHYCRAERPYQVRESKPRPTKVIPASLEEWLKQDWRAK